MAPATDWPAAATNWREQVPDGEPALLEALADQLAALQRKSARGGKASRALHAKGNVGVRATFEVRGDLPEHAKVALFAQPGTYATLVRFSNGASARQADRKPDVRGVALKLLGVPGKKLIPGMEDATTQDFLLIRNPVAPFRNPSEFVGLVTALASPLGGLPRFIGQFGLGRTVGLVRALLRGFKEPNHSLATAPMWSALPIQLGPYAVRFALRPHLPPALTASPNDLGAELAAQLRAGPVAYDFQLQFFVNEAITPIEDPSVDWAEVHAPYVTVARLTLSQQDVDSAEGRALADQIEALSFDPWHALAELKPLGAMMRARNAAYRVSTRARHAAPEPTDLAELRSTGTSAR